MPDTDAQFFAAHPDRKLRIREPVGRESEKEFLSLGQHQKHRRRIIVCRVASGMPTIMANMFCVDFMRIPFLLFADETVEDRDDILAPILNEIMGNAAKDYGMAR